MIAKGDRVFRLVAKQNTRKPPIGIVQSVDQEDRSALVFWRHAPYRVPLRDLEKV